jgi:hypothetical protein
MKQVDIINRVSPLREIAAEIGDRGPKAIAVIEDFLLLFLGLSLVIEVSKYLLSLVRPAFVLNTIEVHVDKRDMVPATRRSHVVEDVVILLEIQLVVTDQ